MMLRALLMAVGIVAAKVQAQETHTLVLKQEPVREVLAMADYSRTHLEEDARCAVRWRYGADGDSVLVDSLGPATIAHRDSTHVVPPAGTPLCRGPLFHTHLLWMLTFPNNGYIAPRTVSGCDAIIAIREAHPWDVIVDVTPITFAPFLYVVTDTVLAHYTCP